MPSEEDYARVRQARDRDFQFLVEALVVRGYTPESARAFVMQFEHKVSNLAVHDSERITHEHQATSPGL